MIRESITLQLSAETSKSGWMIAVRYQSLPAIGATSQRTM